MRRRLATTAAAVTAMVVLAFCVPLALVVRIVARDRAVHSAELESRSLAAVLAGTRDPVVLRPIIDQANAESSRPATVSLPDGTIIGSATLDGAAVGRAKQGQAFTDDISGGVAVVVPVQTADGTSVVYVFVPDDLLTRGVYTAWLVLGILAIALVLIAVALADRLGRNLVTPMQQLRDVAHRLREGDRTARAGGDGPAEVAEVADALNRLADRIDELVAAEREAAADLSHRLRTPLTALRLDVEQLPDPAARGRLVDEVAAVETAVDDIIRAARATPTRVTGSVDVVETVRDRLQFWSVLAENQGRRFDIDLGTMPITVTIDAAAIDAAIDALLGNVFAHTPDGTRFRVAVEPPAIVVVEDDGPGIADADAIARGASGAGSTGLGLDIARRTAEAAGGELRIDSSPTGGTRVELVLTDRAVSRR